MGAAAATIGMVLPSFLIIFVVSQFIDHFLEIGWVHSAFMGIKLAVGILILDAGLTMLKKMKKKPFQAAIVIASFAAMMIINVFALHISTITLMVTAAFVSLAAFAAGRGGEAG
jgi:chromate transporter